MNKKFKNRSSLVLYFLKGSKRYFASAVICAFLFSLVEMINPKIISFTVDNVLGDTNSEIPWFINIFVEKIGIDYFKNHLYVIALIIIFVALLSALFKFLFRYFNNKGGEYLVKRMRDTIFEHILNLPFSWFNENKAGEIIQRCTSDVDQVKSFLSEQLTPLFRVAVLLILTLYFMFSINFKLAFVTSLFIPVIILSSFFFHRKIGKAFRKVDEEEGHVSAIVQENLTGVRVVRAFGREIYEKQHFEEKNEIYTDMWVKLMRIMSIFWTTADLVSYLQTLVVLVYGSYLCVHGELTAGNYIAFMTYTGMLMWPVRMIGRVMAMLSRASISIDRIMYIMNSEEESDINAIDNVDMYQDITFENVNFNYDNSKDTLNDINLTIHKGETIGILGGTGSGKSTLMYLLDRLYELPEENGSIKIGDTDIRNIKRSWLRKNIGMVLQEPYLFSRSLEDNIRITSPDANHEEVSRASQIASLERSILHFNDGYDTYVGERGVTLSGGQKQRTAIAQMLLRKTPIMIFDDSLSAVDAQTDSEIRHALKNNVDHSTIILIAHRITTLMNADKIVVMDGGRIVQMGSHDDLINQDGIYKKIYELQLKNGLEA